jgi:hypothetical protein
VNDRAIVPRKRFATGSDSVRLFFVCGPADFGLAESCAAQHDLQARPGTGVVDKKQALFDRQLSIAVGGEQPSLTVSQRNPARAVLCKATPAIGMKVEMDRVGKVLLQAKRALGRLERVDAFEPIASGR